MRLNHTTRSRYVVTGAVLLIVGFGLVTGAVAQQPKVVIAVTSPQSGPQAAWGSELIRGAELALAEYDPAKLKFKYEILALDDQADPKVGITVANKLKVN